MRDLPCFLFLAAFLSVCSFRSSAQQLIVPDQYSTIQSAIDAARPGEIVLVRAGSYHEYLVLRDSVILRSEGTDDGQWNRALRTIIHSEGLRDGNGNVPPVVNCADGAVLEGFTVTGMDTVNHHLPGHSHAVQNRGTSAMVRDCIVHSNGSTGIGAHDKDGREANPKIIHNKVYRNFGIGIGFNHTSKGEARDNHVFENREVGIGLQNGAAPLVINNIVYGNGWNGISAREGAWPRIEGNEVYENGTNPTGEGAPPGTGAGIGLDSTGWIARPGEIPDRCVVWFNNVYRNPTGGIMSRNHALFAAQGNRCTTNANMQIAVTDSSVGLLEMNTVTRGDEPLQAGSIAIVRGAEAEVRYNSILTSTFAGIAVSDAGEVKIIGNNFYHCEGSGVHVSGKDADVLIEHNTFTWCEGPAAIFDEGRSEMRFNILAENASGVIIGPDAAVGLINNTIVSPAGAPGRGVAVNGRSGSVCFNNIVHGYTIGFFLEENPVVDYNCTFNNQGYNGPPGTGGANAISADPLFDGLGSRNYRLRAGSPCIDAGNPGPQFNDPDGSRNDIGAFTTAVVVSVGQLPVPAPGRMVVYPTTGGGQLDVLMMDWNDLDAPLRLQVYSVTGQLLHTGDMVREHVSLDLQTLPNGLYFLRVLMPDGPLSAKFRIAH